MRDNEKVKVFLRYINLPPGFIKTMMGGDALQLGNIAGLIAIVYQESFILFLNMLFAFSILLGGYFWQRRDLPL